MAAMCSKEDARDSSDVSKAVDDNTAKPSIPSEKQQHQQQQLATKCPTCKGSGTIAQEQPGKQPVTPATPGKTVDIDDDVEDKFNQLPPMPSPLPTAHRDFVHCMPPEAPTYRKFSVFTAGSIEMGKAVQWQKRMALELSPYPITVNNPRRGHWDPNATQEAKNDAFRQQVEWELSALEQADVICFFFDVNTMSPVTMLELGLWASSGKVIVCCDKRFWRAGNVHIVCGRYGIPCVDTFAELPGAIVDMLKAKGMQIADNGDLVGENVHVEKAKPKTKHEAESEIEALKRQVEDLQAKLGKA
ncbi:hypothetical protein ACN47E_004996 [Coniothyrium glycines]